MAPTEPENNSPRVYLVLERAALELHDSKGTIALLNSEEHQAYLSKVGRDVGEARPDIVHQCLLALLDSPLNQSGTLQIYIHTAQGILIQVHNRCRIPRTFRRFSGLMAQLLRKQIVRASDNPELILLQVIKGSIQDHIPENALKLGLAYEGTLTRLEKYLESTLLENNPVCFAVGAMAKGHDDFADDWIDAKISVSGYPLYASAVCSLVCCSCENVLGIN